jgi:hypothetical protein
MGSVTGTMAGPAKGPGAGGARHRWLAVSLLAVWALVLVGAGVWSAQHDPATVREQTDLAQGRQTLDRAVAAVVAAAGPGRVAEVRDHQVSTGCRITLAREGAEVRQVIVLTAPQGRESDVLDRLADRLPEEWQPRQFRSGTRLFADAGDFVSVVGTVPEPGLLHVTVSTGCRPGDDPVLITDTEPDTEPGPP